MCEFQSQSTVEQNGAALFMATPGKTQNRKPETPNHRPKPPQTCPAGRPAAHRAPPAGRALRPPSPRTSDVPRHLPSQRTVRAPRADAPPYRQAETFSATRAASASAHSGRILLTSRPPAAAPDVGRCRCHRYPGGGRSGPAPATGACDGGRGRGHGHTRATVGPGPPPLAASRHQRRVCPVGREGRRLPAARRRVEAGRAAVL